MNASMYVCMYVCISCCSSDMIRMYSIYKNNDFEIIFKIDLVPYICMNIYVCMYVCM